MTTSISFVIPGTAVAKGRPKFARRGAFVTAYTPAKTVDYEKVVKAQAVAAMAGRAPIDGPVEANVHILVIPPASWSKKKRAQALEGALKPTSKPDIDNTIKGIFDAMNDIVWCDDKQVCVLRATKSYAIAARVVVSVREMK